MSFFNNEAYLLDFSRERAGNKRRKRFFSSLERAENIFVQLMHKMSVVVS